MHPDRLFGVLREHGPWRSIAAQTFSGAEQFLAVAGGNGDQGRTELQLGDLIAATFRGYFAQQAVALHEEVQDIFYSSKLLELVKNMFGARYALPAQFFFNLRAPADSLDAGYFDPQSWRGMDMMKPPVWLAAVTAKSGLFDRWEVRTGQVITYYYPSAEDGGSHWIGLSTKGLPPRSLRSRWQALRGCDYFWLSRTAAAIRVSVGMMSSRR